MKSPNLNSLLSSSIRTFVCLSAIFLFSHAPMWSQGQVRVLRSDTNLTALPRLLTDTLPSATALADSALSALSLTEQCLEGLTEYEIYIHKLREYCANQILLKQLERERADTLATMVDSMAVKIQTLNANNRGLVRERIKLKTQKIIWKGGAAAAALYAVIREIRYRG